jgi:hypothetical protein
VPGGRSTGPPGQLRVIIPLLLPSSLYPLAERFEVTISALRVRLEQFNLLYVDQQQMPCIPHERGSAGTRLFRTFAKVCGERFVLRVRLISRASSMTTIRGIRIAAGHREGQVRCLLVRKDRRMPVSRVDDGCQSPASASSGPVLRASIACSISSTMFSSPTLLSKMIGMSYGTR